MSDFDLPSLDFGLDMLGAEAVQRPNQPTPRACVARRRKISPRPEEGDVEGAIPTPPAKGECIHVVSNGTFDYFTFIPLVLDWIGRADSLYGSTWTMNRSNVADLLRFYRRWQDRSNLRCSGNYFLRRESAVAATLLLGLRERGQSFCTWENHAKVILLNNAAADAWFVVEGSANWTANPRTEQNILLNDRATWEFHRDWLESMFSATPPPAIQADGPSGEGEEANGEDA